MLILKQQQIETHNECGGNNTVQAQHHQLRQFDASSLDDLLGCGVEFIDAGEDNDDAIANVSTEIANYLKLKIKPKNTDILN